MGYLHNKRDCSFVCVYLKYVGTHKHSVRDSVSSADVDYILI